MENILPRLLSVLAGPEGPIAESRVYPYDSYIYYYCYYYLSNSCTSTNTYRDGCVTTAT